MEIFLTNEYGFQEDKSGPLNSEEHQEKVLKGAKVKIEEKSHVGLERRTRKCINKGQVIHYYHSSLLWFLSHKCLVMY